MLLRMFRSEISDPKAKVIIGPYPTAYDFRVLKHHRVTTIISLLDPALPYESTLLTQERDLARQYKMRFYSFAMSSVLGIGFGTQYAQHAREAAAAAMQADGKVYLHCYLGLHRVKVVQATIAGLGGTYDHYRLRQAERASSLQVMDSAQAYFDAGEYQRALDEINQLKTSDAKRTVLQGWSLYRLGHIDEAENSFHRALDRLNSGSDAYSGLGYCAIQRSRLPEAEENFNRVLKLNPDDSAALIGLGIVRYRQNRGTEAVKYLKKGLASGPRNSEAQDILRDLSSERTDLRHAAASSEHSDMTASAPTDDVRHGENRIR